MTAQPWAVQIDDSVSVARQMLVEREIRHLPVVDAGELVGMVTERDLATASGRVGAIVGDVMTSALAVDEERPLDEVLAKMLERRRDAVVVTGGGRVRGIFTAMDAVRLLRERRSADEPQAST
jgi:acetoin utilization protein AcuB